MSCKDEEIIETLCDDILLASSLKECSNEELIKLAIGKYSDYTMHPVVEEMMDRLHPGWEGTDENEE